MRKKPSFTLGTLGLAMAGSLFLGCQDFLGGDNGKQAAPSDNGVEHAAQAAATLDSAKDAPAQSGGTAQDQPAPAPVNGSLEECKYLFSELQANKENVEYYMDIKYKLIGKNCAQVVGDANPTTPPPPPVDSATQCKNLANTVATLDPSSPKYDSYKDALATQCAAAPAATGPAATEPVNPASPPSSSALTPEQQTCLDLSNVLQSATTTEENYSQAKGKFLEMNCASKPASAPYTPPTLEERCKLYRMNLTETQPVNDPKWQAYMDEMAKECVAYP